MTKPLVSVIFGSYNRVKFLKLTVESIRSELIEIPHEIIAIDGGSDDGSFEYLLKQKDIITIVQHNRGMWNSKPLERRSWGYFMNLGFKIAQGKYCCMVSDDCLLVPGAIKKGCDFFETECAKGEKVGAVAFWWRNWTPEQLDYKVCKFFNDKLYVNHGLYLTQVLKDVGYIDEENYSFYAGDVDLCLKLVNHGYRCVAAPDSFVEHYPHAGLGVRKENETIWRQDIQNLMKKWGDLYGEELGICDDLKKYVDQTLTGEKFKNFEYAPAVVFHKTKHTLRWRAKWLARHIQKIKTSLLDRINR